MTPEQHNKLVRLIQELRREWPKDGDKEKFRELIYPVDMRWSVSIFDTEVDHFYPHEAPLAHSVFMQMAKLMDSVVTRSEGQRMYNNVHSFNRRKDDMINNLWYRLDRACPEHLKPVWQNYLLQLRNESPSFAWLSEKYDKFWEPIFYPGRPTYEDKESPLENVITKNQGR